MYLTGGGDLVRCYASDGGLQKWSPEDSAWVEHARWFPHCAYVRQVKGEDYVQLVRLSAEHQQLEEVHFMKNYRKHPISSNTRNIAVNTIKIEQYCFVIHDIMMRTKSEPRHDKTNKMSVRPAKTQISLGIRPV